MRKSAKIFAVLLTLCLLCGVVVSVVASAAEPVYSTAGEPVLDVTGADLNYATNWNGGTAGKVNPTATSWSNDAQHYGVQWYSGGNYAYVAHNPDTVRADDFVQGTKDGQPLLYGANGKVQSDAVTLQTYYAVGNTSVTYDDRTVANYKYVTVDFDFGTDAYTYPYTSGETTVWTKDINDVPVDQKEAAEANKQLALVEGYSMHICGRRSYYNGAAATETTTGESNIGMNTIFFTQKEDGWYVYEKANPNNAVKLVNKVGEFDHFTYVIEIVPSDVPGNGGTVAGYYVYSHLYINGKYFYTAGVHPAQTWNLQRLYTIIPADVKHTEKYSIAYDNFAVNYYSPEFLAANTNSIGAMMAGDYENASIYNYDNVVYSADYVAPNADSYVKINGVTYKGNLNAAVEANVTNGSVIETNASISLPADVLYCTVIATEGTKFYAGSDYNTEAVVDGDTTTYTVLLSLHNNRNLLNATGHAINVYNAFNDNSQGTGYGLKWQQPWNTKGDDRINNEYVTVNGNGYFRLSNDVNDVVTGQGEHAQMLFKFGNHWSNKPSNATANTYEYMIFDFDFGTDKYVYNDGTAYHTAFSYEEIPEAYRDTADLAFIDGTVKLLPQFRDKDSDSELRVGDMYTVKGPDGKWYLSTNNSYSADDILMSNEVGKFDHITWVIKPNYDDLATSKLYTYVNGQFLCVDTVAATTKVALWGFETNGSYFAEDRYSLTFDNFAFNVYDDAENKDSVDATITALNTYFSTETYKTDALSTISGIVYDADYVSPNGFYYDGQVITSVPNTVKNSLKNLAEGTTVYTSMNLDGIETSANKFSVVTIGDVDFSFAGAKAFSYKVTQNANVYDIEFTGDVTIKTGTTLNTYLNVEGFVPDVTEVDYFTVIAHNGVEFSLDPSLDDWAATAFVDGDVTIYTVASTKSNDASRLNITKDTFNSYNTFNTTENKSNTDLGYMFSLNQSGGDGFRDNVYHEFKNNGSNNYFNLRADTSVAESATNWWQHMWSTGKTEYFKHNMQLVADSSNPIEYIAYDVDFGTDRYVYTDGAGVQHTALTLDEIPEEYRSSATVAIYEGGYLLIHSRNAGETRKGTVWFVKDADGVFYFSADDKYSADDIKMSNEVGVFDHITWVIKLDYTDGKTDLSKNYIYINGEYLAEGNATNSGYDKYAPVGIEFVANTTKTTVDNYSMAIDNIAINVYNSKEGTTVKNYVEKLNTFFSGETYKTKALYDDSLTGVVVYDKNYASPNGFFGIKNGDTFTKTYIPGLADDIAKTELVDGAEIVTFFNVEGLSPAAGAEFTVKQVNGSTVGLSELAKLVYKNVNGTYKASGLSGALANLSLFGDMNFNYYIPKIEGVTPSAPGVTFTEANVDGKDYYVLTVSQSAAKITPDEVVITLTSDSESVQFTAKLDAIKYADLVLQSDAYECGSDEKILVKAILDYKKQAYIYDEQAELDSAVPEIDSVLAAHTECACNTTLDLTEVDTTYNMDALLDNVVYADFVVGYAQESGLILEVNEEYDSLKVTYNKLNAQGTYDEVEAVVNYVDDGTNTYYVVSLEAAFLTSKLTITANEGTATEATGTYSLAAYIVEVDLAYVEIAEAMYKYSVAAFNYKYEVNSVTE